jgi:hypothetical protein
LQVNGKESQVCPRKGLSWLTLEHALMVRVAVGKADLYILYVPKSSGLRFQVCFPLFPVSLLPAGTSSLSGEWV